MPETLLVSSRLTHRYRLGWRHLDQWDRPQAKVKALAPNHETTDDDICQNSSWTRKFTFKRTANHKQLARAIADTTTQSRCQHEWDCCGCWTTYARVITSTPRSATLHFTAYRNY